MILGIPISLFYIAENWNSNFFLFIKKTKLNYYGILGNFIM